MPASSRRKYTSRTAGGPTDRHLRIFKQRFATLVIAFPSFSHRVVNCCWVIGHMLYTGGLTVIKPLARYGASPLCRVNIWIVTPVSVYYDASLLLRITPTADHGPASVD